jgi:hypothetical protein
MLSTSRSRVRALAVVGMAAVTATIGAVTYNASAAEVAAPAAAPAAFGPGSRPVSLPLVPDAIKPPAGSKPIGAYIVTSGVQKYTCLNGVVPAASNPEAELAGTGGKIHHFGGPTGPNWQSERDSSLVVGAKDKALDNPGSIPQLLLHVVTHSGAGVLAKADFINRLYTSGGVAPSSCTGTETIAVPYKAVYVFWDDPAVAPV